jgi:hypothetical protein
MAILEESRLMEERKHVFDGIKPALLRMVSRGTAKENECCLFMLDQMEKYKNAEIHRILLDEDRKTTIVRFLAQIRLSNQDRQFLAELME